jgi:hypothetical protein
MEPERSFRWSDETKHMLNDAVKNVREDDKSQ